MGLTAIAVFAPGDTITSADANARRGNDLVLDARTGGDPAATGKVLISNGATSAAWVLLTAITNAITTNQTITGAGLAAGATGISSTGPVTGGTKASGANLKVQGLEVGANGFSSDAVISALGALFGASGMLVDGPVGIVIDGGGGLNILLGGIAAAGNIAGGNDVTADNDITAGGDIAATGSVTAGTFGGGNTAAGVVSLLELIIGADGLTVGAAGISTTGPISANGTLTVNAYAGGTTLAGVISLLGAIVGTSGIALGGQLNSSVTTGTAPFVVASTTLVSNLHAARATLADTIATGAVDTTSKIANGIVTDAKIHASGLTDAAIAAANKNGVAGIYSMRRLGTGSTDAAAGNHTHATSANNTYTGTGGGSPRVIANALDFSPKMVVVTEPSATHIMIRDNVFRHMANAGPIGSDTGGSCDANGFTVPPSVNTLGVAYTWSAFS